MGTGPQTIGKIDVRNRRAHTGRLRGRYPRCLGQPRVLSYLAVRVEHITQSLPVGFPPGEQKQQFVSTAFENHAAQGFRGYSRANSADRNGGHVHPPRPQCGRRHVIGRAHLIPPAHRDGLTRVQCIEDLLSPGAAGYGLHVDAGDRGADRRIRGPCQLEAPGPNFRFGHSRRLVQRHVRTGQREPVDHAGTRRGEVDSGLGGRDPLLDGGVAAHRCAHAVRDCRGRHQGADPDAAAHLVAELGEYSGRVRGFFQCRDGLPPRSTEGEVPPPWEGDLQRQE